MENRPEQRTLLLALFLITGTVASIAGMRASHSAAVSRFAGNKAVLGATLAVIAGSTLAFFGFKNLGVLFAMHIVMKYLSNMLYNVADPAFAAASSDAGRTHAHVQSVLLYQVLGIAGASLYFALWYSCTTAHIVVISVLAAASFYFAAKHLAAVRVPAGPAPEHEPPLSRFEKYFLAYYLVVLSLIVVFQGTLIYFLDDHYHFADAKAKGGILLGILCVVAAITIVAATALPRRRPSDTAEDVEKAVLPASLNYVLLALFLAGGVLLYAKLSVSFAYVVAGCTFLSAGTGIFLFTTRNCASVLSVAPGRPNTLKLYNNSGNYAVLLSFAIVLALSQAPAYVPVSFSGALAVSMGILFACAVCLVFAIDTIRRRAIAAAEISELS